MRRPLLNRLPNRVLLLSVAVVGLAVWIGLWWSERDRSQAAEASKGSGVVPALGKPTGSGASVVRLKDDQIRSIGLQVSDATKGKVVRRIRGTGRILPDETSYAVITPRASGIIRAVLARVGQDVEAGAPLATIESSEVGQGRLQLLTSQQALEVAQTRADWQRRVYENTRELIDRLAAGDTPEQVHQNFQERPLGDNRERLVTAYAQFRLADRTVRRNRSLSDSNAISREVLQQSEAEFEAAQATFQSLMDQMEVKERLENIRAQQALREAQTTVRVGREQLRLLGVDPDAVWDVDPQTEAAAGGATITGGPASVYELKAPISGKIIDQEPLVPGIPVSASQKLFTLANLSKVWVEVDVHESDFGALSGMDSALVRLRSRSYADHEFTGQVIYTGDLVNEKSRTIRLLASADNSERRLKPGMFVDVVIEAPESAGADCIQVPSSALVSEDKNTYLFVLRPDGAFERREVVAEPSSQGLATIREGISLGERVVASGAFALKAELLRVAAGDSEG